MKSRVIRLTAVVLLIVTLICVLSACGISTKKADKVVLLNKYYAGYYGEYDDDDVIDEIKGYTLYVSYDIENDYLSLYSIYNCDEEDFFANSTVQIGPFIHIDDTIYIKLKNYPITLIENRGGYNYDITFYEDKLRIYGSDKSKLDFFETLGVFFPKKTTITAPAEYILIY